jgi:hypothetical protein
MRYDARDDFCKRPLSVNPTATFTGLEPAICFIFDSDIDDKRAWPGMIP